MACNHRDGEGNLIPCSYCGCPTSGAAHTEATDEQGRKYCSICHNWL
jgi:hypothetical protein